MARSPARGLLPPIRTTYDDSYVRGEVYSPEVQAPDNRINQLENRIDNQERTTQQLLERAIRIKQDLMENLNYTHGTWQEEREARELLQDHVKTITAVVKQMNKDVKDLEGTIKNRDASLSNANNSLKTLETHHVAGITDLRGRVARCDAAIGKLASDLKLSNEQLRSLGGNQTEEYHRLVDRLQGVDNKITECHARVDRLNVEGASQVKHTEDEVNKVLNNLEMQARAMVEDLRHKLNNLAVQIGADMEKVETRMSSQVDSVAANRDRKIEKLDLALGDFEKNVTQRMNGLEQDLQGQRSHFAKVHKDFDLRLVQYADLVHKNQTEEITRLKREMREGFATLQDTVSNMKSVLEGKQKLLEESLRREISQIRKMVVLI